MGTIVDAVTAGDAAQVETLLRERPELAAERDGQGVSLLLLARYRKRDDLAGLIRAAGPPRDVFDASADDEVALLRGLLDGDPALARAWSGDGFTALHFAAFFGAARAAALLLAVGAEAGAAARNPLLVQPLHSAVAGGHHAIAAMLLSHGADASAAEQRGWTCLHTAGQYDDRPLAELLLAFGGDPLRADDDGATPVDFAERAGNAALAALLAEAGSRARSHA